MKALLYRDMDFEDLCNKVCRQWGSGVLITTDKPHLVHNRLNVGWPYQKEDKRRFGTRTPPLAFFSNWTLCQSWDVIDNVGVITRLPEFWKTFDRPCMIAGIERRLMQDDNDKFPELRAKGMSKNGLECTFCLKPGTYSAPEDDTEGGSVGYQEYLARELVKQIDNLVDELAIRL